MSEINPYSSPLSDENVIQATLAEPPLAGPWVFRKGNQLVMHKGADLPDRCVKSNQPANGLRLRRNLSWHHPLIFLTLFIGILIYVILAIVLRKQATIYVGLSKPWFRKRRRAILIGWGLALLGIAIMVGSFVMITDPNGHPSWIGWGLLIGLFVLLGGIINGIIGSQIVRPARITDDYVWLKGVHPDYLADLPVWPYHP